MYGIAPVPTSSCSPGLSSVSRKDIPHFAMRLSELSLLRRISLSLGEIGTFRTAAAANGEVRAGNYGAGGNRARAAQQQYTTQKRTLPNFRDGCITAPMAEASAGGSFLGSSLPSTLQDSPPPWVPPLKSRTSTQPSNKHFSVMPRDEGVTGESHAQPANASVIGRPRQHASAKKYIPPIPLDPPRGYPAFSQPPADSSPSSQSPPPSRQRGLRRNLSQSLKDDTTVRPHTDSEGRPPKTSPVHRPHQSGAPTHPRQTSDSKPHGSPPRRPSGSLPPKRRRAEPTFPEPQGSPDIAPEDAPFEFQYSYTETPRVAPIGYREPPYSPFGPTTMSRPWTGGPPLKKAKKGRLPKIIPEFDSFCAPLLIKGAKPSDGPGPFAAGEGPRYTRSREEVLGEPLTRAEVRELVADCVKGNRQVNLGRDGLIHNMLDLIHCHWKRRRVCKVKCKGVPTVDMDNVCKEIEDKTGGRIVERAGGVLYVYRGRNYNFTLRPRFPLMLWKPHAPIYPRLIDDAPPGLSLLEANLMRHAGRKLKAFTRIAKNGVYLHLVQEVREALLHPHSLPVPCRGVERGVLEKVGGTGNGLRLHLRVGGAGSRGERDEEEDVESAVLEGCVAKVDCTGLEKSDYRKIGAKLRDLVPCILISFEKEQILVWKGSPNNTLDETSKEGETMDSEVDSRDSIVEDETLGLFPSLKIDSGDGEDKNGLTQSQVTNDKHRGVCDKFDELWEAALQTGVASPLEEEQGGRKGAKA